MDARRTGAYVGWLLVIAAAYVLSAHLGFMMAFSVKQITAIWPPTGIAVAALVLGGYRMWPGVFVGALVANGMSNEPFVTAAGIAVGNTLGPLLGAHLLRRFDFDPRFARVRDVVVFLFFGSIVAMTVTATNGILQLATAGIVPWSAFGHEWILWWMGDAVGVMLFGPLLLAWGTAPRGESERGEARLPEIVAIFICGIAATYFEFFREVILRFPLYPFVIWAALRSGIRSTTLLTVVIGAMGLSATVHGVGPLVYPQVQDSVMRFISFAPVLSAAGLLVYALMAERRTASARESAAERGFRIHAQSLPQMVWIADPIGRVVWMNQRWGEFSGDDTPQRGISDWERLLALGEPFERQLLLRRGDGVSRWFLVRAEPMRDERGAIVRWYGTHTDIDEQKRAFDRTTRIATTLQSAFLPQSLPEHPRLRFDALYLTAGQEVLIGGDWYDVIALPGHQILISIGDVTGHGLNAAVTAGRIRQSIAATAIDIHDPAVVLAKVNRVLQLHEATMATALVAFIDTQTLALRYASAGHPAPILARPGEESQALPYGSLPLGVSRAPEYRSHRTRLERGSVLVLYTDGVTEFRRDIETAERALLDAARELAETPTARPAEAIRRAVLGRELPADDAVIVVVRVAPPGNEEYPADELDVRRTWSFHSSHAHSAHTARHDVMQFISTLARPESDLFTVELIVGELLANTVEHAPGLVTLEVDWSQDAPTVTIVDTGPGLEHFDVKLPGDTLAEDGRGLFLIQALAQDLTVESDAGYGAKITVVLPVTRSLN
jgi:integral membrane sensor domain MASE1/anti-sigma regulatory factor (Ser/Thr protein kinase)